MLFRSTAQLDPVALHILKDYVPAANLPGQYYQYTQGRPSDGNDVNFKIDYNPTSAHQVVGSYFYTKGQETQPSTGNMPWSQQLFTWKQQNFNVGDTWSVSPTVINQLRLTYVRNFGGRLNTPDISLGDLGSTFNIQGTKSLPAINISGYMNFTQAIQGPIAGSNYYGVRDSVSWMRGKHNLKAGVDAQLEKVIQDTSLNNYGVWSFDGKKTGNALADFMVGLPASFKQDMPTTKIDNEWYAGFFVQDDFRVHPRFTLNLGLRYEMPLPVTDPHDRKMAFEPGVHSTVAPNAPVGLVFPGDPGIGRGIIQRPTRNFAPRVGMAWDPFGDGKTSIRAAGGIFWGSISSNIMNLTTDFQPFAARQTFPTVNTLADPYKTIAGGSPFPITYDPKNPKFIVPADVSTISPAFKFPYTYQLNFSVQRQVTKDLSDGGLRRVASAPSTVLRGPQLRGLDAGLYRRQSEHAAPVPAGHAGNRLVRRLHPQRRLPQLADHGREAHVAWLHALRLLHVRQESGRRHVAEQPTHRRRRGLSQPPVGARTHQQRPAAQRGDFRNLGDRLLQRQQGAGEHAQQVVRLGHRAHAQRHALYRDHRAGHQRGWQQQRPRRPGGQSEAGRQPLAQRHL